MPTHFFSVTAIATDFCHLYSIFYTFCMNSSSTLFCSGPLGRDLGGELPLLKEISRHFYTEESARYLANVLLKNEDLSFVNDLWYETRQKSFFVEWSYITFEVIKKWATMNTPGSLTLLRAMERSNKDAAEYFQEALTCGEFSFFLLPLVHQCQGKNHFSSRRFNRLAQLASFYPIFVPLIHFFPVVAMFSMTTTGHSFTLTPVSHNTSIKTD